MTPCLADTETAAGSNTVPQNTSASASETAQRSVGTAAHRLDCCIRAHAELGEQVVVAVEVDRVRQDPLGLLDAIILPTRRMSAKISALRSVRSTIVATSGVSL